jgi:hypothetical protein
MEIVKRRIKHPKLLKGLATDIPHKFTALFFDGPGRFSGQGPFNVLSS